MQEQVRKQYMQWISHELEDEDLVRELDIISNSEIPHVPSNNFSKSTSAIKAAA